MHWICCETAICQERISSFQWCQKDKESQTREQKGFGKGFQRSKELALPLGLGEDEPVWAALTSLAGPAELAGLGQQSLISVPAEQHWGVRG